MYEANTSIAVPCTRLLITAGAWSPRVFSTLFPNAKTRIPVSSLAGHSLLVRNPFFNPQETDEEVCHAIFATDTLGFSPEWFARIGGELYLAGLNSTSIPLPDVATDVVASEKAIEQLKSCARVTMMDNGAGRELEVLRQGLVRESTSSCSVLQANGAVLPPCHVEWAASCIAHTRREAGRRQDKRRGRGRCVYSGRAWRVGDLACARHRTRACRDDGGPADERSDRDLAVASVSVLLRSTLAFSRLAFDAGILGIRIDTRLQQAWPQSSTLLLRILTALLLYTQVPAPHHFCPSLNRVRDRQGAPL